MKRKSILIILLFFIYSGLVYSHDIHGTWFDKQFNVTLIIRADTTYEMRMPKGVSRGRWGAGGNTFMLQVPAGNAVKYTVIKFTPAVFIIQDSRGYRFNFVKRTISEKQNKQTGILAYVKNYNLRYSHYNAGVDLIQFITGTRIKESEKKELKNQLIREFPLNPSYIINQLEGIGRSMQIVRKSSDPLKVGITRQRIFSEFYSKTRKLSEKDKPLIIQIINRYIKVRAWDEQNKLALTDRDIDSMTRYLAFNSRLSGRPVKITQTLRDSVKKDMIKRFNTMGLEQKRILCSASLMWELLQYNWKRMNQAKQQMYRSQYNSKVNSSLAGNSSYRRAENYNTSGGKSISQQMRDFRAKQNMMTMMQNMNTATHVTSLNIIGNIGGTGDYWKVVDY